MPVKLDHNIFGEGEPVIILHGLFGSSRNWQTVARKLSDSYQVITVDLRNHGQSEHADSMTYMDMAGDIIELISDLSLDKVSLIGHSMGGKVAMKTAFEKPSLVKQLVVLDIAPVKYDRNYDVIFETMMNLPLDTIKNRQEAEHHMNEYIQDQWLCNFLLQNLVQTDQGYQWRINISAIRSNSHHVSNFSDMGTDTQYNGPTLFIGGAHSDFILEGHHDIIHGYFPKAEIDTIENAGHMLHIEQADVLVKKIKSFLN